MESVCIHAKMTAQRTHGGKRIRLNSPVKFPVDRLETGGSVGIAIGIGGVIKLSAVDKPNGRFFEIVMLEKGLQLTPFSKLAD
jgi:hypothetical protein